MLYLVRGREALASLATCGLLHRSSDIVVCHLEASLHVTAMPAEMVHLVEGNLRQIVGVRRVEVVLRGVVRAAA